MKQVRATATKVLGFFVNPPGQHTLGSGLIVLNDEGLERGIKPRYFEVHSVGERTEVVNDIKPGDIVYVDAVTYNEVSIEVGSNYEGFTIQGVSELLTVFNGNNEPIWYFMAIENAGNDDITIQNLTITNYGISTTNGS